MSAPNQRSNTRVYSRENFLSLYLPAIVLGLGQGVASPAGRSAASNTIAPRRYDAGQTSPQTEMRPLAPSPTQTVRVSGETATPDGKAKSRSRLPGPFPKVA